MYSLIVSDVPLKSTALSHRKLKLKVQCGYNTRSTFARTPSTEKVRPGRARAAIHEHVHRAQHTYFAGIRVYCFFSRVHDVLCGSWSQSRVLTEWSVCGSVAAFLDPHTRPLLYMPYKIR